MVDKKTPKGNNPSGNYEVSRFNAIRHGILSQHVVLPWEPREEYEGLHLSLRKEYTPVGPTEDHLVEEIAGIFWRKARLRLTEARVLQARRNASPSSNSEDRKSLEYKSTANGIKPDETPEMEVRRELEDRYQLLREQEGRAESTNIDQLEQLARYEVFLDRKLERTLTMLIKLQDLRRKKEKDEKVNE
jgi:hypothetical protein